MSGCRCRDRQLVLAGRNCRLWACARIRGLPGFFDLDTPVTLEHLERGEPVSYIGRAASEGNPVCSTDCMAHEFVR